MNIHIIGGGNLGAAIAKGLAQFTTGNNITVTRRNTHLIESLKGQGINVQANNTAGIEMADLVILAIKPWQTDAVLDEILPHLNGKIIASAVSGVTLQHLNQRAGGSNAIIRIMPNIAVEFGASATCVSALPQDMEKAQPVVALFNQVGTAVIIDEKLMDAATVLGACGTAFALRYIRASMQAGIEIGFDAKTALAIAAQTALGATEMLLKEQAHPEQLIDKVTTPQGCTIVGLNEMEHEGFSSSLIKGIKTSLRKIKEG
ncbi:pyrroline-5-carboxylate reductase [Flavobacterium akiainvivens]|uniref:Pyrroline-5-carboxylate reductase n=1 Tax=Flavobacterium akiainvivens TaxID=1202724 RepID=A0A0M9VIX5_9FLAO|nr:pyrroline-5-carboxylate reductase [Flavobacterium akiainvivens]KOS06859.1 pyrroline-5-carboxylate reductase [Flavobacterium akiainvivens]SFQ69234.1 pyrroline-5-carboxylate reductase [Flavobacterium akiainvivens]